MICINNYFPSMEICRISRVEYVLSGNGLFLGRGKFQRKKESKTQIQQPKNWIMRWGRKVYSMAVQTFCGNGPHPLLWFGSRVARKKENNSYIPNCRHYGVNSYTTDINYKYGRGPQVEDPWFSVGLYPFKFRANDYWIASWRFCLFAWGKLCTRWFKYDRDWFVCKQAALRSSCATLREWSHNLHPPSCSG